MPSPPVLLVHGFASSFARNWQEPGWVDLLTDAGRTVIELDLPGHGRAVKPHDPAAYEHLDRAVAEVLPDEGQVDAIGFSMGAGLLLAVAAAQPGRFAHLVLGGVGESVFRRSDPAAVIRAVETGEAKDDDSVTARSFARFSRAPGNDPEALAACLRASGSRLTPADLATVTVPSLVVLGDRDFAGPGGPLVDALPDARLVTLDRTDHFATPQDFRFVDAALSFIGAVPG